ncbi:MAG: hypothetical protein K1000chlam3_00021 [Chlamydiae bacterium]|nr:hypothetical protein [Chlamydiota bacterium]
MKHYTYLLPTVLLTFSFAHAEETACICEPKYHRVYVGPDLFWDHLAPDTSEIEGIEISGNAFYGSIRGGYDYLRTKAFYFGIEGQFGIGISYITVCITDYTPLWEGNFPCKYHEKIRRTPWIGHLEQRLGYTFQSPIFCSTTLVPFVGIGGYYLRPHCKNSSSFSHWFYGAIGLRGDHAFSENFDVGLHLKTMYVFAGENRFAIQSESVKSSIRNVWGYEVGIPFTWYIGCDQQWDIQLHPYLLKFDANNTSNILGIRLQFGCNF